VDICQRRENSCFHRVSKYTMHVLWLAKLLAYVYNDIGMNKTSRREISLVYIVFRTGEISAGSFTSAQ
jgi:hypothetical protein